MGLREKRRRQARFGVMEREPMKDDDDDRPKKKITHEIGQDLYLLSVKELEERIALLREEIARLEASIASKQTSRSVADSVLQEVSDLSDSVPSAHTRRNALQLVQNYQIT